MNIWGNMIRRNYTTGPVRTICITDDPTGVKIETYPLWDDFKHMSNPNGNHLPSCYRRLKIFDGDTTRAMGIADGTRVVSMDLDVVILDSIDSLYTSDEPFLGWKRIGPTKPIGYNGSMFMLQAGRMDYIWSSFDPVESPIKAMKQKQYGSDQGWISYVLQGQAPGWTQAHGIYSYSSDVLKWGLNRKTRMVFFNGKHKPWQPHINRSHSFVRNHWC